MVKFIKRRNVIPVDFGEFQLEFVANDESLKRFENSANSFKDRGEEYAERQDIQIVEEIKSDLKVAITELFDAEAFDKIYAFAGESTVQALNIFLEMFFGIVDEYKAQTETTHNTLSKYLS
ncbi:hypothetical protein JDW15_06235 [Aerococcaceae bacterium zg-ZJ1578]|uniref:hypothetical protein n=1 Tax=Aerococcaceae bacterium zg-252 TaxID=2796928 RepID=UPI001A2445CB|nr:hypothetical protein [Aerococcaceae bacterium zg-1578]